jgi:HK97 family phage major capsid protein
MPDVATGATPIAYGNWKRAYVVVNRKGVTMQLDPYSAGFCSLFKFEARIGGAPVCPNAARLLRIT